MFAKLSTLKSRVIAGAAVLVVAGSVFVPVAVHAEDNGPTGVPGQSCPVVVTDANGNETVQQVPVGTRVGLFFCGQDGNWHFGWLVNAVQRQLPDDPTRPIIHLPTGELAGSAGIAAADQP